MNTEVKNVERVIGFDCHPDSFTAAFLRGPTPAAAVVEKVFNQLSIAQIQLRLQTRIKKTLVLSRVSPPFRPQ